METVTPQHTFNNLFLGQFGFLLSGLVGHDKFVGYGMADCIEEASTAM